VLAKDLIKGSNMYKKTTTVEEYFDTMPPQMPQMAPQMQPVDPTRRPKLIQPILKVNVPLMLKLLEYAKEDVNSDMELHEMVENMLDLSNPSVILDLTDFEDIVGAYDAMPYGASCEPVPTEPAPPEPTPPAPTTSK
jgi:hypothetical protein